MLIKMVVGGVVMGGQKSNKVKPQKIVNIKVWENKTIIKTVTPSYQVK